MLFIFPMVLMPLGKGMNPPAMFEYKNKLDFSNFEIQPVSEFKSFKSDIVSYSARVEGLGK